MTPEGDDDCPPADSHLVLEPDTKIAQRRDDVLDLMADDRMPMTAGAVTDAQLEAEKGKEIELAPQAIPRWTAPHFVWAVQEELARKVCGPDNESCEQLQEGGLRVTTTLDVGLQRTAEKWVRGARSSRRSRDEPAVVGEAARLRRVPGLDAQSREQERP